MYNDVKTRGILASKSENRKFNSVMELKKSKRSIAMDMERSLQHTAN